MFTLWSIHNEFRNDFGVNLLGAAVRGSSGLSKVPVNLSGFAGSCRENSKNIRIIITAQQHIIPTSFLKSLVNICIHLFHKNLIPDDKRTDRTFQEKGNMYAILIKSEKHFTIIHFLLINTRYFPINYFRKLILKIFLQIKMSFCWKP